MAGLGNSCLFSSILTGVVSGAVLLLCALRTTGSMPAFEVHHPRQMRISSSKAFHLTGMISRDMGR